MSDGGSYDTDTVVRIETNLDDATPELIGYVIDKLLAGGGLDVFITPVQMKKNRPGMILSVLCEEARVDSLADIIFAETGAFGLRTDKVTRLKLHRRLETVQTEFGEVVVKLGFKGDDLLQVAPEFESCRTIAAATGRPLRLIYDAAVRAFRESRR